MSPVTFSPSFPQPVATAFEEKETLEKEIWELAQLALHQAIALQESSDSSIADRVAQRNAIGPAVSFLVDNANAAHFLFESTSETIRALAKKYRTDPLTDDAVESVLRQAYVDRLHSSQYNHELPCLLEELNGLQEWVKKTNIQAIFNRSISQQEHLIKSMATSVWTLPKVEQELQELDKSQRELSHVQSLLWHCDATHEKQVVDLSHAYRTQAQWTQYARLEKEYPSLAAKLRNLLSLERRQQLSLCHKRGLQLKHQLTGLKQKIARRQRFAQAPQTPLASQTPARNILCKHQGALYDAFVMLIVEIALHDLHALRVRRPVSERVAACLNAAPGSNDPHAHWEAALQNQDTQAVAVNQLLDTLFPRTTDPDVDDIVSSLLQKRSEKELRVFSSNLDAVKQGVEAARLPADEKSKKMVAACVLQLRLWDFPRSLSDLVEGLVDKQDRVRRSPL